MRSVWPSFVPTSRLWPGGWACRCLSCVLPLAEALAQLTPREERILRMRFGIGMPDHTLGQVGKSFGVTRERIRQIEAKALQKLSHPTMARKLLTFTER